jgi:hemerythrin-like domain-containing protein
MPKAPNLLNDDGSASMATAVMMSHHALRRDIAQFASALKRMAQGDVSKAEDVREEWQRYRETLHGHHEAEDTRLFPHLSGQHTSLTPTIQRLTEDHRRIDPLLDRGDLAFAELPQTAQASALVAELTQLLDAHLAVEEAELIPFLRDAKGFPSPSSEAEERLYAEGFAWSSHGIAPEVLAQVDAMLSESLRARLTVTRAEFAARCERVWGPAEPGASFTAVPDR